LSDRERAHTRGRTRERERENERENEREREKERERAVQILLEHRGASKCARTFLYITELFTQKRHVHVHTTNNEAIRRSSSVCTCVTTERDEMSLTDICAL